MDLLGDICKAYKLSCTLGLKSMEHEGLGGVWLDGKQDNKNEWGLAYLHATVDVRCQW